MWLIPKADNSLFAGNLFWTLLDSNSFFALLQSKSTSQILSGGIQTFANMFAPKSSSSSTTSSSDGVEYRIVLKAVEPESSSATTSANSSSSLSSGSCHVVAQSQNRENIMSHWVFVLGELLPAAQAMMKAGSSRDDVVRFLLDKIASLALDDRGEGDGVRASAHETFSRDYELRAGETLIASYQCSLAFPSADGASSARGTLFLTDQRIVFRSAARGAAAHDVEIALCDVSTLAKDDSSLLGGLVGIGANIRLSTTSPDGGGAYVVSSLGFARDELYDLLQQVWMIFMERRLKSVEAAKQHVDVARRRRQSNVESAESTSTATRIDSATLTASTPTKKLLEAKQRDQTQQRLFKLPDGERVQRDVWASLWHQ
jgi:hypothetical protein